MTAEWKGRSVESHARRFLILACTYYFNGFRSSQSVNQLFLPVGGWEITTQQSSRAESVTGVLHLELFILRRCIDCRGQQDNLTTAYHPPSPLLKSLRARLMDMAKVCFLRTRQRSKRAGQRGVIMCPRLLFTHPIRGRGRVCRTTGIRTRLMIRLLTKVI